MLFYHFSYQYTLVEETEEDSSVVFRGAVHGACMKNKGC